MVKTTSLASLSFMYKFLMVLFFSMLVNQLQAQLVYDYKKDKDNGSPNDLNAQYTTSIDNHIPGKRYFKDNESVQIRWVENPDWVCKCQDDYFVHIDRAAGFSHLRGMVYDRGDNEGGCNSGGFGLGWTLYYAFQTGNIAYGNNTVSLVRYEYHQHFDNVLGVNIGRDWCDDGDRGPINEVNFCVLHSTGDEVGSIKSAYGDGTTILDAFDANYTYFEWVPPVDYCSETVFNGGAMQVRLISYNGNAATSLENDWAQQDWEGPHGGPGANPIFAGYTFNKGFGEYVLEARMKDQYGTIFKAQQIKICYVPACTNDYSPTVNIKSQNASDANTLEIVDQGYTNGNTTGGYKLDKNVSYTLNLYQDISIPTITQGQNGVLTVTTVTRPEITNFNQYYTVVIKDGMNNDVPNTAVELIPVSPGVYTLIMHADIGAYTIKVIPDPSLTNVLETGCTFTCQMYDKTINLFVGGGNETGSSNCFVILPRDFKSLFPDVATDFAMHYILTHFTYTVISKKGILIQPGQDYILLKDGAHLVLKVTDPDDKDQEFVDNDKNWSQSWVYDESGVVVGESKSFYDSRGQSIQSQSKNISGGVVLCTQNVVDRYGRPAIQTLPAPLRGTTFANGVDICGDPLQPDANMFFRYEPNFVTRNNKVYNYLNFDRFQISSGIPVDKITGIAPDPIDIGTPGTLGWYYSVNNKSNYSGLSSVSGASELVEKNVPVSSYPYSRTIFKTDGTGMPKATTLPGDQHHSASQHYDQSDIYPVNASDPDFANDEVLIADYLTLYQTVFSLAPASRVNWKVFKSVSQEMSYSDASGVTQQGNKSISYIDGDQKTLISYHPASSIRTFIYYDALGRAVCSITPKGVEQWKAGVAFSDIDKTITKYNSRGLVIQVEEKDAGITRFMYRKDGTLCYTQNAQQALSGKFSYVLYDQPGRPIESGEYTPITGSLYTFGSPGLKTTLEYDASNSSSNNFNSGGTKQEVVTTYYDIPLLPNQEYTAKRVVKVVKDNGAATYFSYDVRGRVIWTQQDVPGLGSKIITYKYATNGQLKEVAYQPGDVTESFFHYYKYDQDGRLSEVRTGKQTPVYDGLDLNKLDNTSPVMKQVALYEYYLHGPLKKATLGTEQIDYLYTIQGWLKGINADRIAAITAKGFAMTLDYYNGDYTRAEGAVTGNTDGTSVVTKFNGLISSQTWRTEKPSGVALPDETYAYKYSYDNLDQLTNSVWGKVVNGAFQLQGNAFREGQLTYDVNGNINTLARYTASGSLLHNFTGANKFVYEGASSAYPQGLSNKLSVVPSYSTYNYNAIGQLTNQTLLSDNSNRSFVYNMAGLVNTISANSQPLITYFYDATGRQFRKDKYSASGQLAQTNYYIHDASGNVLAIYEQSSTDPSPVLSEYNIYGADRIGQYRKEANIFAYVYELKDHLGSVRALIWQSDNTIASSLYSYSDYYPYGLRLQNFNDLTYKYGYQGEYSEFDVETGLNHFKLRDYDPFIGRWFGPDPYRVGSSPYMGMGNKPTSKKDPNGGIPTDLIIHGSDENKVTIKAPGRNFHIYVDFAVGPTRKYDFGLKSLEALGIGYIVSAGASSGSGAGVTGSGTVANVMYFNSEYGGYWYSYLGVEGTVKVQLGADATLTGSAGLFLVVNKKGNFNPETFAGSYKTGGASAGVEAIAVGASVSGQYSDSEHWRVYGLNASLAVGPQLGFSVGIFGGGGYTKLLTPIVRTSDRTWGDILLNQYLFNPLIPK